MPDITPTILESVRALVDYNWADEKHDCEISEQEGNDTEGHIFQHLRRIDAYLNSINW